MEAKTQLEGVNLRCADWFVDWNGDGDFQDGYGNDLRLEFGYPEQPSLGIDLEIHFAGGFSAITSEGAYHYRFENLVDCAVSIASQRCPVHVLSFVSTLRLANNLGILASWHLGIH